MNNRGRRGQDREKKVRRGIEPRRSGHMPTTSPRNEPLAVTHILLLHFRSIQLTLQQRLPFARLYQDDYSRPLFLLRQSTWNARLVHDSCANKDQKVVADLWERYLELLEGDAEHPGVDDGVALDQLGLKRYCCRRMVMTHVDLIEKLLR